MCDVTEPFDRWLGNSLVRALPAATGRLVLAGRLRVQQADVAVGALGPARAPHGVAGGTGDHGVFVLALADERAPLTRQDRAALGLVVDVESGSVGRVLHRRQPTPAPAGCHGPRPSRARLRTWDRARRGPWPCRRSSHRAG